MSKFNRKAPVRGPDTVTFEGGAAYTRDPKSDRVLLAVVNMAAPRR